MQNPVQSTHGISWYMLGAAFDNITIADGGGILPLSCVTCATQKSGSLLSACASMRLVYECLRQEAKSSSVMQWRKERVVEEGCISTSLKKDAGRSPLLRENSTVQGSFPFRVLENKI